MNEDQVAEQKGQIVDLFPTPIYITEISEETHKKTLEKIKDIKWGAVPLNSQAHEMNISKVFKEPDFSADVIDEYDLSEFYEELLLYAKRYLLSTGGLFGKFYKSSWITRYKKGDYAQQHCHGTATVSVAYYLATNSEDGDFYFSNSSPEKVTLGTEHKSNMFRIPPTERKLILFPGWLEHGVERNNTDNLRMCLSANLTLDYSDLSENLALGKNGTQWMPT